MEKTAVQKMAGVLKILVTVTFVCNLLVLPLLAGLSRLRGVMELVDGLGYFSAQGEGAPEEVTQQTDAFDARGSARRMPSAAGRRQASAS